MMTVDDIDADATLEKIRQVSGDFDIGARREYTKRELAAHCQRLNIVPVMIGELD
jgi:hypothetical protein